MRLVVHDGATGDDRDRATTTLARGFADEPGTVTLLPDPGIRLRITELVSGRELRASLPYGTVHGVDLDGRLVAVAIWHPPHVRARSSSATARTCRDLLRGLARADADGLAAWLETTEPVNPPLHQRSGLRTVGPSGCDAWR